MRPAPGRDRSFPGKTAPRRSTSRSRCFRRSRRLWRGRNRCPHREPIMPRILIITGEASGDLHGANLARAIWAIDSKTELVGIGGAAMRAAGVILVPGVPHLDVMGLIGLSAIRAMVQRIRAIRRVLKSEPWDLVVLIDNPGLNFHFA